MGQTEERPPEKEERKCSIENKKNDEVESKKYENKLQKLRDELHEIRHKRVIVDAFSHFAIYLVVFLFIAVVYMGMDGLSKEISRLADCIAA